MSSLKDPKYALLGSPLGAEGGIVVMGFPFSHGSAGGGGCEEAPGVLRRHSAALQQRKGYVYDTRARRKLCQGEVVSDLGDLRFSDNESKEQYLTRVQQTTAQVVGAGRRIVALGGDHLLTLPLAVSVAEHHHALQVVQLDAHADYKPLKHSELPCHGSFVARLAECDAIKKIIQIGVRGLMSYGYDLPKQLVQVELAELAAELLPGVPIYLSVDTDAFDPTIAPGVGHPVPGGLTWQDMSQVITMLANAESPLVALDWMEYVPRYDTANHITAKGIIPQLGALIDVMGEQLPSALRRPLVRADQAAILGVS